MITTLINVIKFGRNIAVTVIVLSVVCLEQASAEQVLIAESSLEDAGLRTYFSVFYDSNSDSYFYSLDVEDEGTDCAHKTAEFETDLSPFHGEDAEISQIVYELYRQIEEEIDAEEATGLFCYRSFTLFRVNFSLVRAFYTQFGSSVPDVADVPSDDETRIIPPPLGEAGYTEAELEAISEAIKRLSEEAVKSLTEPDAAELEGAVEPALEPTPTETTSR